MTTPSWAGMSTSLTSALLLSGETRYANPHVQPHEDYAELRPPRGRVSVGTIDLLGLSIASGTGNRPVRTPLNVRNVNWKGPGCETSS